MYYAVNNFEDAELHLDIQPNEWLCVELAAVLPQNPVSLGQFSDDDAYYELSDQSGPLVEDLYSPFPCPPSATKVVFFQGAASFSALAQVFAERSSGGFPIGKVLFGKGDKQERKEYITMRGPRGKGQCEVGVFSLGSGRTNPSLTCL